MLTRFYKAEPIIALLLGNAALWPTVFSVLSAFGHPLTDSQQQAIVGVSALISTLIARASVVAPDTHEEVLKAQQAAQGKG